MKTKWIAVLGFLSFFMVTFSGVVQAEEKVILAEDDYFLAISFTSGIPNQKRFKFNKSVTQLDVNALFKKLKQVEEIQQILLYKDGIAITRNEESPWEELEKKVMHILKDQCKVTGYVLLDGDKLTEEQIQRHLSGVPSTPN